MMVGLGFDRFDSVMEGKRVRRISDTLELRGARRIHVANCGKDLQESRKDPHKDLQGSYKDLQEFAGIMQFLAGSQQITTETLQMLASKAPPFLGCAGLPGSGRWHMGTLDVSIIPSRAKSHHKSQIHPCLGCFSWRVILILSTTI